MKGQPDKRGRARTPRRGVAEHPCTYGVTRARTTSLLLLVGEPVRPLRCTASLPACARFKAQHEHEAGCGLQRATFHANRCRSAGSRAPLLSQLVTRYPEPGKHLLFEQSPRTTLTTTMSAVLEGTKKLQSSEAAPPTKIHSGAPNVDTDPRSQHRPVSCSSVGTGGGT